MDDHRIHPVGCPSLTQAEVLLQYFNASWNQIAEKVPELAEAGYTGIWLPPPAKANGGYSVGYDLYDPFDLGSTSLRGTYSTPTAPRRSCTTWWICCTDSAYAYIRQHHESPGLRYPGVQ
jgi:hypothetical protein